MKKVICIRSTESGGTLLKGRMYEVDKESKHYYKLVGVDKWWRKPRFMVYVEDTPESSVPPIGLRPRHIVARERLMEILAAMQRYAEAGKSIPDEWDNEYDELREWLNEHYAPEESRNTMFEALLYGGRGGGKSSH